MKRIAVFCGSNNGSNGVYENAARELGEALAERRIGLVYGGTSIGLMNQVANGALAKGGEVIGVIPGFLADKGIVHPGLTELFMVNTMHERKEKMHQLSEGVIALPGGFGTMEELFEAVTWAQLGIRVKPVGLLNINGFYDPLKALAGNMISEGFLRSENLKLLLINDRINDLLALMDNYLAPSVEKWIPPDIFLT